MTQSVHMYLYVQMKWERCWERSLRGGDPSGLSHPAAGRNVHPDPPSGDNAEATALIGREARVLPPQMTNE